jgi:glycine/D-amino acid oxidase-like deaminating enzyme
VLVEEIERCRAFLAASLPALADAALVGSRLCLYCDTRDGDFWIDRHPEREGLIVAAGGSGHAFKFAPVLGEIVADVVEGRSDRGHGRFAWREQANPGREQARLRG